MSVDDIAMWFSCLLAGTEPTFIMVKDQKEKEVEKGFLKLTSDILRNPLRMDHLSKGDNYLLYPNNVFN